MDDTPRILIVDDDASTRFLARTTLARAGLEVLEAGDGEPALRMMTSQRPDLVLLDVSMPEMDGFQVCEAIRKLPDLGRVPVLMMTSLDDVESINRAFEVGATDFITKPVNWVILGHRVRYMLRTSRGAEALRTAERRLSNAQRLGRMGDWEWDLKRDRIDLSDEMYAILGLDRETERLDFEQFMQAVHWEDAQLVMHALHSAASSGRAAAFDHRIVQKDGTIRYVHQQVEATRTGSNGEVQALAGAVQDVTQRRQDEERIRHLAYYDPLTGLPNRVLFSEHLRKEIARARRDGSMVAVMVLDLDQFKQVNDTLGHEIGDELLRQVGHRLQECVRGADVVMRDRLGGSPVEFARLGGDEFTLLIGDLKHKEDAGMVAQRLMTAMADPFQVGSHETYSSTCIGIALFPDHGDDPTTLLMNADTATYRAKTRRRNSVEFYDRSMNASARQRLWIEAGLRVAIERDELVLQYQPKVEVVSGRTIGCEALVRWRHPERGLVPPNEFIPVAEESGLITEIARWALRTACRQIKELHDAGLPRISVSVNLSCNDLRNDELPRIVEEVLRDTALEPEYLDLEVTESRLMEDLETSLNVVQRLEAMGLSLSVDDFGTGYSSLSYLKRLPLTTLKIDRSFIREVAGDTDDAAIAGAIIAMAHSLKLNVVAEGLETIEQLEFLAQHGCDQYQGYLFSRPVYITDLSRLLEERTVAPHFSAQGPTARTPHPASPVAAPLAAGLRSSA
jgi:diguanylate cyclase (GGDEF)-like protein/PAS domain S-box-containing protein